MARGRSSAASSSAARSVACSSVVELPRERRRCRDHVVERRPVLLLQTLEHREPILDLLQPRRRRVDRRGYERRKYARSSSCDLTASRAAQVRRELRVDRGELADLLPDRRRAPAAPPRPLRTARVRLGAQPLQPVGVGEHLPRRGQLLVFAGLRARRVESRSSWNARNSARRAFSRSLAREPVAFGAQLLPARERRRSPRRARLPAPANASSRSRCAAGSSSTWCSCWPWRSTSRAAASRSAADVTSAPSTNARLRPCAETSRRTISSAPSGVFEDGLDRRLSSPVRTRSAEARPPTSRPTAPTRIDLPAPGLPGQHVQARLELELEAVDDGEVADGEEAEHRARSAILSDV